MICVVVAETPEYSGRNLSVEQSILGSDSIDLEAAADANISVGSAHVDSRGAQ